VPRKRSESPTPIRSEIRRSFSHGTGPGSPIWIGRRVPRSQTAVTQSAVTWASKQIWLTMYVPNLSFSNIALIVAASEMNAWLSG
jgi:hypothetical protein